MLIPIIPKDTDTDGFSCRDGEIEYASVGVLSGGDDNSAIGSSGDVALASVAYGVRFLLSSEGSFPVFNVRIPLFDGEEESASLMLSGSISRVDAAIADRITSAIVEKTVSEFSKIVSEHRRLGLHLLPFRVYCLVMSTDGDSGYPSAQPVMLPSESLPHPEITASSVTTGTLSLSLRIPVCPCRLSVVLPEGADGKYALRTFVSYPLFIPDFDEISGSLGSVSSASGGNALGVRLSFLSVGNMKSSVAAPEKYYQLYGNKQTGYRLSAKAMPPADYSIYAGVYPVMPAFATAALVAVGSSADPFCWIADWERYGNGCIPLSVPYSLRGLNTVVPGDGNDGENEADASASAIPEKMDAGMADKIMSETGWRNFLITRPMAFAASERSRRKAERKAVKSLHILGIPSGDCIAVLLGSDSGSHYEPLRIFDPNESFLLLSPPRLFHRLLLISSNPLSSLALDIQL